MGLGHSHGPHHHDPDREDSGAGIRAVKISLVILGLTAAIQLLIVAVSGSVALLADTVHNVSDALTAVPLWIAFALSRRAASRRYTYGYGRVEDLAGLFIVAMIALSAVVAGWEAIARLIRPAPVGHLGWVAIAGVIGFAGNELVAVYRIRIRRPGRRRTTRPHRRTDLPRGCPRIRRRRHRIAGRRPHRRPAHCRRNPRCAAHRSPRRVPPTHGRRRSRPGGHRGAGPAGHPGCPRRSDRAAALARPHPARRSRHPHRPPDVCRPGPPARPRRRSAPDQPPSPGHRRHHPRQPHRTIFFEHRRMNERRCQTPGGVTRSISTSTRSRTPGIPPRRGRPRVPGRIDLVEVRT